MASITSHLLTVIVVGLILIFMVFTLMSKSVRLATTAPTILTSMGIFGTFLGIAIGLLAFDPQDVRGSVPHLFGGIQMAFWTSVTGILAGLIVRFKNLLLPEAGEPGRTGRATVDDLARIMRNVEKSLSDEDQSPLLSGLRNLHKDSNSRLDELKKTMAAVLGALPGDRGGERDSVLASKLDAISKGSTAALEALLKDSKAGLDALGKLSAAQMEALQKDSKATLEALSKLSGAQLDELSKRLGTTQAELMNRFQAAFLEELQKLRQDSNARLGDLNRTMENVYGALLSGDDTAAMLDKMDSMHRDSNARSDELKKAMSGVAGLLATDKESALLGKLDQIARGSTAALEALQKDSRAGMDALGGDIARALGDLSKALVGGDGSMFNQLARAGKETAEQMQGVARAIEGLRNALGGDSAAMIERLEALGAGSQALGDTLGKALGQVHGALVGSDGSLAGQLARAARDTAEQMQGVSHAILELRNALGGDSAALLDKLEALRKGTDTLGEHIGRAAAEQMGGMARALGELRSALGGDSAALLDKLEALRKGSEAVGDTLGRATAAQMGDMARALGELRSTLGGDSAALLDKLEALRKGSEAVGDTLGRATAEQMQGIARALTDLRHVLAGPEGLAAGVSDQLRQGQQEANKALQAIKTAVEENTKRQVDYSPKALMQVLEEMVRQFNTQFSGQFWDKFSNFNQALGQILEWMETYRRQMTEMIDQQSKAADNMDTAARRFDEIASKSEIFIDVSKNISALLGGLDTQRVQLESHLKRFAHIVDVTSADLEDIEHKIVRSNEEMNNHIRQISRHIEEQVVRMDHALDDELTKAMNSFGQQLAALSEKFVDDYTPLTERLRDVVNIARGV